MPVQEIENDDEYQRVLSSAGNKLIVVDFFATWCGPCKMIAPVVETMSNQYSSAIFIKVDTEKCRGTAAANGVSSIPTFLFYRSGRTLLKFSGANQDKLRETIEKLLKDVEADEDIGEQLPTGQVSLFSAIDFSHSTCLNVAEGMAFGKGLFSKKNNKPIKSDCDEQLLFHISFTQPIKLHSFQLKGPSDGTAPKTVKFFINKTAMDFSSAEDENPTEEFELTASQVENGEIVPAKYVRFQNVHSLYVFVADNQGEEETTTVSFLRLIGQPRDFTNMSEFKRVAGEAGEAHD